MENNKAFRLDKQRTNQACCTQVETSVPAWRSVQRVQICLNGRSCAAVDAGISPRHDVTIQNPQIALVNIKSVVLQLRQPGGALLSFSPMNCTLYASSTPGGVGNAMVRESHVMLNASCVHTRIFVARHASVESAPSCQRPLRPFIRRRWAPSPSRQSLYLALPREVKFFFHEYGRRVGMVPRSSLKGGKVSRMVEKKTRTTTTTQQKTNPNQTPKPAGRNSTIL